MMRYLLFLVVIFSTITVDGQAFDSVLVKQEIDSLILLGGILAFEGKRGEAIPIIEQAKERCLNTFGKESSLYLTYLLKHGYIYSLYGDHAKGNSLFIEGQKIAETIGEKRLNAIFLINIGINYQLIGAYISAENYYLKGASFMKKEADQNPLNYAQSLVNLASFYQVLGAYEKAEKSLVECINITKDYKNSLIHCIAIRELANVSVEQGKLKEAEQYNLEANERLLNAYGEGHQEYASGLISLGTLYKKMGRFNEAEELLLKGSSALESFLGKEHLTSANALLLLGNLYLETGSYKKAEEVIIESKETIRKLVSRNHYMYAKGIEQLVILYYKTNRLKLIDKLLAELFLNQQFQVNTAFSFLSENQKQEFLQSKIYPNIYFLQSLALNLQIPDLQDISYNTALMLKGIQLQSDINTLKFVLQQKDTIISNLYGDLMKIRRRLSSQYQLPIAARTKVEELEAEQETVEKQLARLSATFRAEQAAAKITHQEVKATLKPNEAAIEFVHFDYENPEATDSILYAAVVLLPDAEHAQFIALFEEKQLNKILQAQTKDKTAFLNLLYASRGIEPTKDRHLSEQIYNLIWQPLDSLLSGVETIYFSPTGLLHRLNLAALPISEGRRVGDQYQLFQLSSTRQIALNQVENDALQNKKTLVVGGVHYDKISNEPLPRDSTTNEPVTRSLFQKFQQTWRSKGDSWAYLPYTDEEASSIHQSLQTAGYDSQLLTDTLATEEAIKSIGTTTTSPRILHLATHGFFFPKPEDTLRHPTDEPVFVFATQPMIRSGLVLAGANAAWSGKSLSGEEDGILTAYEIAQMNLTNTELVVLSACETGLGDIKDSEGVYGLQRAFKMAGVKYLIMSLWKVPDEATKNLMTAFYTHWLEEGMDIPTAFNQAQNAMRKKYKETAQWAGFVLVE